jgi:hypothetical protein
MTIPVFPVIIHHQLILLFSFKKLNNLLFSAAIPTKFPIKLKNKSKKAEKLQCKRTFINLREKSKHGK